METSQTTSSIRYTSHVLGQVEAWVRPTVCYANVYRRRLQQMETSQSTSRIQNTSNVLGQAEARVPPNQPTSRMRYFSLIFSVKAEAHVPRSLKLCAKKVSPTYACINWETSQPTFRIQYSTLPFTDAWVPQNVVLWKCLPLTFTMNVN